MKRRADLVARVLVQADLLGLSLAFAIAQLLTGTPQPGRLEPWVEFLLFLPTLPAWILIARLYGLYGRDEQHAEHWTADDFVSVFHLVTVGTWLVFGAAWLSGVAEPHVWKVSFFWLLAIALVTVARGAARAYCRRQPAYIQNTVILGAGEVGQLVARKLLKHPEYGLNLVGFVDAHARQAPADLAHVAVLGPPEALPALVDAHDVERVVVAFSNEPAEETLDVLHAVEHRNLKIDVVPRLFEILGPNLDVHAVEGFPLVNLPPLRLARAPLVFKRVLDVGLAIVGLVVVSPLLAYVAVRIKLDSPGPVLYRSRRVGRGAKEFELLKFRTMHLAYCRGAEYGAEAAELEFQRLMGNAETRAEFERTRKLQDDPRLTPFGRFLRRTSIDELPQLINVIKGDISLVGPRAITTDEFTRYNAEASSLVAARPWIQPYWANSRVRPGVTGYWQVNGRSDLSYHERVRLDLMYVESWSLRLDVRILAKTLRVLSLRAGAY